jgi:hypothetical protein
LSGIVSKRAEIKQFGSSDSPGVKIVRKLVVIGWITELAGTALWLYGYFVSGHTSIIDWQAHTPWWISEWLPNIESEAGLALVLVGTVLIYWPGKD